MTINSGASIQMGGVTLTEDKLARMEAALEFIERFAAENEEARAVWTAIKAKKRILK
jgi:ribosomal protein S12 methylthiotransferase accessory factor YcaO